jgi:hypothetical protein
MALTAAMLTVLTAGLAAAQAPLKLAPLEPVPVLGKGPSWDILFESEPGENFHGQGQIQRVEKGKIVIGDVLWAMSATATYFKKSTGSPALPQEFAPGAYVGYYLNGNRAITSLWLIDPPHE